MKILTAYNDYIYHLMRLWKAGRCDLKDALVGFALSKRVFDYSLQITHRFGWWHYQDTRAMALLCCGNEEEKKQGQRLIEDLCKSLLVDESWRNTTAARYKLLFPGLDFRFEN